MSANTLVWQPFWRIIFWSYSNFTIDLIYWIHYWGDKWIFQFFRIIICFLEHFFSNRKQFLNNNNAIWMSIKFHKKESIAFIRFIGRQHDSLTEIMDKINFCYSLQVKIESFLPRILYFTWWDRFYIRSWSPLDRHSCFRC